LALLSIAVGSATASLLCLAGGAALVGLLLAHFARVGR
jgi:hypothetical protein